MILQALLVGVVSATLASPLPTESPQRVLYNQRQDGDLNVHAELKNIVVMVIPSQTSSPSPSHWLDFLLKSLPERSHSKRQQAKKAVPGAETMHFIESKTAPYHVDISRSKSHLAKLHPELPEVIETEEIVIAKSPTVELVKDENPHARIARAFVLTVPQEEGFGKKKDGKKKSKETVKSVLKLLGAENEQCGPGLARDSEGVCRTIKK
jgi:hypothetical protein